MNIDHSTLPDYVRHDVATAAERAASPAFMLKADLIILTSGNWLAKYGSLEGKGATPEAAFADFDSRFRTGKGIV